MKKNVGIIDKIFRIVVAIVIAYVLYAQLLVGVWAIVLGVFGFIMLVTALTGFCGIYKVFGFKTCPAKSK
jgi:hypothetical protein